MFLVRKRRRGLIPRIYGAMEVMTRTSYPERPICHRGKSAWISQMNNTRFLLVHLHQIVTPSEVKIVQNMNYFKDAVSQGRL